MTHSYDKGWLIRIPFWTVSPNQRKVSAKATQDVAIIEKKVHKTFTNSMYLKGFWKNVIKGLVLFFFLYFDAIKSIIIKFQVHISNSFKITDIWKTANHRFDTGNLKFKLRISRNYIFPIFCNFNARTNHPIDLIFLPACKK